MNRTSKKKPTSPEKSFYIGLVLKGTLKQYAELLKYVKGKNGAKLVYQCDSSDYLFVARGDKIKVGIPTPESIAASSKKQECYAMICQN